MKTYIIRQSLPLAWIASLFLMAILLVGCDTTFDQMITPGSWLLNKDSDSVLIWKSMKLAKEAPPSVFVLSTSDLKRLDDKIEISVQGGSGELTVDGVLIVSGTSVSTAGKSQLTLSFLPKGTITAGDITITIRDKSSNNSTAMTLHLFDNRAPQAALTLRRNSTTNPLYVQLDASLSSDPDEKWEDKVASYEYIVESSNGKQQQFVVLKPITGYPFPDYGDYTVRLTVRDRNEVTSGQIIQTISLKP